MSTQRVSERDRVIPNDRQDQDCLQGRSSLTSTFEDLILSSARGNDSADKIVVGMLRATGLLMSLRIPLIRSQWLPSVIMLCCWLAFLPTDVRAVASLLPSPVESESSESESESSDPATEAACSSLDQRTVRRRLRVMATICRPHDRESSLLGPWGHGAPGWGRCPSISLDEQTGRNGCGGPLRC